MQWKITILINFMYGIIIINYILDQQEKIISRKFRKQKKKTIYLNFWFFLKSKVILKFRKKIKNRRNPIYTSQRKSKNILKNLISI